MARHFKIFGRGFRLRLAITLTCQLAFLLFGYDQGVFSGVVKDQDWLQQFGNPQGSLQGIIVSIYNLGAFSGAILNIFTAERLGRRNSMWFAMGWIIVGAILQTTSYSLPQLLVARYVTGIGTGIETSTTPMYQAELCEADKRGRLVASEPMFVSLGIIISYFFDFGMSYVGGPISWRLPIACQIIFALLVIVLVFGVPESPRYLYNRGRTEEALEVLCDVYDQGPDGPRVRREQKEIQDAIAKQRAAGEYRWSQLFKGDSVSTGRRVVLAYGSQFMQQMSGINLLVYFVPSALTSTVGLEEKLAQAIGGCVQTMYFFGSLIPTFYLDRLGRRRPLMWGAFACGISMMLISILTSFSYTGAPEMVAHNTASASIAFFFTYIFFFGATLNCITWVYVPEILPLHARAKGSAIATSANWLWNFVVVMISPSALDTLQWKAYLIFMALNLAFVPIIYFFYPETSNMTLEEIDVLFTEEPEMKITQSAVHRVLPPSRPVLRARAWPAYAASSVDVESVDSSDGEKKAGEHVEYASGGEAR